MNDYAVVTAFLTLQRLPCSIAAITVQHLGQSSHSTQAAIYTWALQCCRASCSIPRLPAGPSKRASRAPGAPSSVEMVLWAVEIAAGEDRILKVLAMASQRAWGTYVWVS